MAIQSFISNKFRQGVVGGMGGGAFLADIFLEIPPLYTSKDTFYIAEIYAGKRDKLEDFLFVLRDRSVYKQHLVFAIKIFSGKANMNDKFILLRGLLRFLSSQN